MAGKQQMAQVQTHMLLLNPMVLSQFAQRQGTRAQEPDCLGSNPRAASSYLCDLQKVTQTLCASISFSVKLGQLIDPTTYGHCKE